MPPTTQPDDCAAPPAGTLVAQGCRTLDDFMTTFNSRDPQKWAATLNFPHVRLAGGQVVVWETPADYAKANDLTAFAQGGWAYSRWDWRHLVQASDDKLHFTVQFTRYKQDGTKIASFESLYIVTKQAGHWGVAARSSYAGIAKPGAAF